MNSAFAQATGPAQASTPFPWASSISLLGDGATIVLAVVAVVTLIFAWRHLSLVWQQMIAAFKQMETGYLQLETAREQLTELVENNRARLLFDLDSRWDSAEMIKTRRLFKVTYDEIERQADIDLPMKNAERLRVRISELFHEKLESLKTEKPDEYHKLHMMICFFETAGMLCKKDSVPAIDIIDLYAGSILRVYWAFKHHLENEGAVLTSVPGMFEYALALGRATIIWTEQRQRGGETPPDFSIPTNE